MKLIGYCRTSTSRQNLGLQAQQEIINRYACSVGCDVPETFVEQESGSNNDRPKLHQAISLSKMTGSRLVVAKLDRLSRDAAFILTLKKSGVNFVIAENPAIDGLTIGILAVLAEHERKLISERTRQALAVVKASGKRLGPPDPIANLQNAWKRQSWKTAQRAAKVSADEFAELVKPTLVQCVENQDGRIHLSKIADCLNDKGIRTRRGGSWKPQTVKNVIQRLGLA